MSTRKPITTERPEPVRTEVPKVEKPAPLQRSGLSEQIQRCPACGYPGSGDCERCA